MTRAAVIIAICLVAGCRPPTGATRVPESDPDLERILRRQSQELLDAVTAGDPKVWDRYLDPRMTYVSEAGAIDGKATMLPQVTPLPKGISGKLWIDKLTVTRFGDTATTVYIAKETEDFFGVALTAEYLMTDTWRHTADGWRLILSHVYVRPFDPPAIELPAAQLDEYAGTYRMSGDRTYTIRRDGAALAGERPGKPAQPLRVEARDVLFVPGEPRSRKIFQRDGSGRVTGFLDRREGHDVPWTRMLPP